MAQKTHCFTWNFNLTKSIFGVVKKVVKFWVFFKENDRPVSNWSLTSKNFVIFKEHKRRIPMLGLSFLLLLAKDCGDERLSTPLAVHYHPYVNDCFLKIFLIYKLLFILHCLFVHSKKSSSTELIFWGLELWMLGRGSRIYISFPIRYIRFSNISFLIFRACSAYRHHRRIFSYKFDTFPPKGIM